MPNVKVLVIPRGGGGGAGVLPGLLDKWAMGLKQLKGKLKVIAAQLKEVAGCNGGQGILL